MNGGAVCLIGPTIKLAMRRDGYKLQFIYLLIALNFESALVLAKACQKSPAPPKLVYLLEQVFILFVNYTQAVVASQVALGY